MCKACGLVHATRSAGSHRARLTEVMRGAVSADTSRHPGSRARAASMVPRMCDSRLTRQPRKRILHGLMQGGVKALDPRRRRDQAAALGRDLQPCQPARHAATLSGVQRRQRSAHGEGRAAGISAFQPLGNGPLGRAVGWAESQFGDSGGHDGSRVSWPWKITKPPRILNGRYPFVKPFLKV